MPRPLAILCGLLLVLAAAPPAWPDGKVFPAVDHGAAIPDQQALIAWRPGREALAIETRFEGTGSQFAWVVPLPAAPEISPATPGLFPTLRAIGAPNLISDGGELGIALLFVTIFIAMLAAARGAGAKIAITVLGLLLLFPFVLFPSLGRARGPAPETSVTVLDRRLVGAFQTSVIQGPSAEPLIAWLTSNGFAVDPAARPVIADYAARGWVFAAARLTRDADGGWSTPHPLVFRFPASEPVYPLKLTGVQSGPVTVELCVFAEGTATVPGFHIVRSFKPRYEPPAQRPVRDDSVISHHAVRALAGDLPIATFLRGTLSPRQMSSDATVTVGGFSPQRESVRTPASAAGHALDVGMICFTAASILIMLWAAVRQGIASPLKPRPFLLAVLGAALIAFPLRLFTSTVPVTSRGHLDRTTSLLEEVGVRLFEEAADAHLAPRDLTVAWAREHAPNVARALGYSWFSPREEDSPGNYTFRQTDAGPEFHWYDRTGNEAFLLLTEPPG